MSMSILADGLFLLQAIGQTLPDTQVVKQVTADPGVFQKVTTIADGLMSITIVVLTVALVPAAWNFHRTFKRVNQLLDQVYGDVAPLVRHATTIADDVNYISTALRSDVQRVSQTVTTANQQVVDMMQATERRVQELQAFLDVVQDEAEDVFVSTASAIRGVRSGATALHQAGLQGVDGDMFEEELSEALDDVFDNGDLEDGIDDELVTGLGPEQPRIRPRRDA